MIELVLSGVAAVTSVTTLVFLLRRTVDPRARRAAQPVIPEAVSRPSSWDVLSTGPRFYLEAIDPVGNAVVGVDFMTDDAQEIEDRWEQVYHSEHAGTFTLWDRRAPGHRGRFSRGLA